VGRGGGVPLQNGPNNDGHGENNGINGQHGLIMYGRKKVSVIVQHCGKKCSSKNITGLQIFFKFQISSSQPV
jgi:hypothetical protein